MHLDLSIIKLGTIAFISVLSFTTMPAVQAHSTLNEYANLQQDQGHWFGPTHSILQKGACLGLLSFPIIWPIVMSSVLPEHAGV